MTGALLIRDLAVVMLIAGGVAWVCQKARLSAIVGYLVAGTLIGPYTPPFTLVDDTERVQTLAQIGLVFLIFFVGLNLSLSRLKNLGLSIIAATAIAAILVLNGARLFGWALGWTVTASLFLAGLLMVSSSAVISKVLDEHNLTHERPGQLALGVTVLEDVVAIAMLTLLTSLVRFGGESPPQVLPTLGALGAFITFLAILSLLIAPRLLANLSRHALPEIRTLVVLGLLLALAWFAVQAGYSLALGAFIFGAIVGSTRYKADIERTFEGLQQMFGAVFFVAIGMQVDFRILTQAWPLVIGVTALALLLRPLACSLGLLAVGHTSRDALHAGLTLTPLGEFSFIIAQLGVQSAAVPETFYATAVGASLLTSLTAPFLTRHAETLSHHLTRFEPRFVTGWITFYHAWLSQLRQHQTANLLWRLTRRPLTQVALHILSVSALILIAAPAYERIKDLAGRDWPFPGGLPFLFWSAFGLLLLGPLIATWRNVSAIALIVAESATRGNPRQRRLRPLLETALRTVALVVLTAWLLALLPSGWSLLGAAGLVLLLLAAIATLFWRRLVRLHSTLEFELLNQIKSASHPTASSAWFDQQPAPTASWNLDLHEITLPLDTTCAGKTVSQIAVRRNYGCSLVGIDRQGYPIVNPTADVALYPLDKLLLLGTADQLAQAARALRTTHTPTGTTTGFEELTMESVTVPPDSPLAHTPHAQLDHARTAMVQIGAIRRGPHRNLNPGSQDHFEPGDLLLVLGTHTQIRSFRNQLAPPRPHTPEHGPTPSP